MHSRRRLEVPPNQFGLYHMIGNVMDWNEDCWNANYSGAPTEGTAWQSGDCGRRVLRVPRGQNTLVTSEPRAAAVPWIALGRMLASASSPGMLAAIPFIVMLNRSHA